MRVCKGNSAVMFAAMKVVCLACTLINFVEGALSDKMRHHLLCKIAKYSEKHENVQHLVLETLQKVTRFEIKRDVAR